MDEIIIPLSADRPSIDPAKDLYGHAPFAKTFANAIRRYRGSDCIILALYGPWGSGKSTVLAYVEHELKSGPENDRPVIVSFNPWWFSGHEHLAKAFLGQLQAVLPEKHRGFKALGDKLAEFSGALGSAVELAGAALGVPLPGMAVDTGAKTFATKPKDIPALKESLSKLLLEEKKRIVVFIDDIDRLAPDEIRQLFTVVKALADFPYVTYLLAFDREVAATAISQQTGLPGERYLEKIVQVPFELPLADRSTLHQALFSKLEEVMSGTPKGLLDEAYWINVFYAGLDRLFTVPRDLVRLTNAVSVTYPAVVGEVNPVDFIAIECLRVFLPPVYDAIRTSPEEFYGHKAPTIGRDMQRAEAFHNAWLSKIRESLQGPVQELLQRLFPRLESIWSSTNYSADALRQWRQNLRVCSPEIFPTYFKLSLPQGAISRADLDALLAVLDDERRISDAFRSAATEKSATGTSKARALLERLMDHVHDELNAVPAEPVVNALLLIGDELLISTDKISPGYDAGNDSRITRIIYHLLKKLAPASRAPLIERALVRGQALRCSQLLLSWLFDDAEKAKQSQGERMLEMAELQHLKEVWRHRIAELSADHNFINHPTLARLLSVWCHWGGEADAKSWWRTASKSDEGLVKLISAFASEVTSQTVGDYAVRTQLRVNPLSIERYGDVQAMAGRVQSLLDSGGVGAKFEPAARRFLLECGLIKEGKNPDDFDD